MGCSECIGVCRSPYRGRQTGILQYWIDALIVGMVENVQEVRAQFHVSAVIKLKALDDREVSDVGVVIAQAVPPRRAPRSTIDGLRFRAVHDEADLLGRHWSDRTSGIHGREIDQAVRRESASDSSVVAGMTRVHTDAGERCAGVA